MSVRAAMEAQLELDLCPTCGQPLPPEKPEPLRCSGPCGRVISEDEVFVWNDYGKFCAESECTRKAFRTLL